MIKFKLNDSKYDQAELDDLECQIEEIRDQLCKYYDQSYNIVLADKEDEQEYNRLNHTLEVLLSKRNRLKSRKNTRDAVMIKKEEPKQSQTPLTFKLDGGYKVEVLEDGNQSKMTLYKEAVKTVDFIKQRQKDR